MASSKKDATTPIRLRASHYPDADEGTSCTQASFKVGKKAFLYIGMQGGRHKAMFKLEQSIPEATKLSNQKPDRFSVGSTAWITARFTDDDPMPKKLWEKWLDESYQLSIGTAKKVARKPRAKKTTSAKKATKKKSKS